MTDRTDAYGNIARESGFRRTSEMLKRAFSGWNVLGTLTLLSGIVIGVGIPVWQNLWIQRPVLTIEMNSIRRDSQRAIINIDEYPELSLFRSIITQRVRFFPAPVQDNTQSVRGFSPGYSFAVSLDDLTDLFATVKREIQDLPGRIDQAQKDFDQVKALKAEDMTVQTLNRLNRPLSPEVRFDYRELEDKRTNITVNTSYFDDLRNQFVRAYEAILTPLVERQKDISSKFSAAEKKSEELRTLISNQRSIFRVTAILTNSGGSSISLRAPALLRVYIGAGNYVDLKLLAEQSASGSDVKPNGSLSTSFASDEINTFPKEDQDVINHYWGQNV